MSDQFVAFSKQGNLGRITLNRPPANSYNLRMMEQLDAAISAAEEDDDVRVIIVDSASDKFFSAGADIKAFHANPTDVNMGMIEFAHQTLSRMGQSDKIYIAAINGHVLGGGLEIALACDLRLAKEGRYFLGLPEVTLGLLPGNGGTQRLARLVGANKALELMITGERVDPQTAASLGIVNKLIAADNFAADVQQYAATLAAGATLAIGSIKRAVYDGIDMSLADGLALECKLMAPLFDTADATEGFTAFEEKRSPKFSGR